MATLYEQYIACAKKFTQIKHKFSDLNYLKNNSPSNSYKKLYAKFVGTLNFFNAINKKYKINKEYKIIDGIDFDDEEFDIEYSLEDDRDDRNNANKYSDDEDDEDIEEDSDEHSVNSDKDEHNVNSDKDDHSVKSDKDDHSVKSDKDDKDDAEHRKQVSDLCDKEIAAADVEAKISYYKDKYYDVKYELDELKKRHYAQYDNATNLDESLRNELAKLKKEYDIMAENLDMTNGICHTLETKLSKIEAVINAR